MKFNILSVILLVLLIISLTFAFFQKTEADAARTEAQHKADAAIVCETKVEMYAAEAQHQAALVQELSTQLNACQSRK